MIRVTDMSKLKFPAGEITLKPGGVDVENADRIVLLDDPNPESVVLALEYGQRVGGIHLVAGYFPSARMDKPGAEDTVVMARIIAGSGVVEHITVLDPHSPVTVAALKDAAPVDGWVTVVDSTEMMGRFTCGEYTAVVAPDQGAVARADRIATWLGVPMVSARKVRDQETGRIRSYEFTTDVDLSEVLVVDDICDGGATFRLLSEHLPGESDLMVSHGVFSGHAVENLSGYRRVITTDSLASARNLSGVEIVKMEDVL